MSAVCSGLYMTESWNLSAELTAVCRCAVSSQSPHLEQAVGEFIYSFLVSLFLFLSVSLSGSEHDLFTSCNKDKLPPLCIIWCESLSVKLSVAVEDKRHRAAAASQSQMTSLTALQPDAVRHRVHVTVTEPRPPDVSNLIFSMLAFWC